MKFTIESQLVKNYVLLINNKIMTIEQVPNIYNLKEVVQQALTL